MSHSQYEHFQYNCISWSQQPGCFTYHNTTQWLAHSHNFCQASGVFYSTLHWGRLVLSYSLAVTLSSCLGILSSINVKCRCCFFFPSELASLLPTHKEYPSSQTGGGKPKQLPIKPNLSVWYAKWETWKLVQSFWGFINWGNMLRWETQAMGDSHCTVLQRTKGWTVQSLILELSTGDETSLPLGNKEQSLSHE